MSVSRKFCDLVRKLPKIYIGIFFLLFIPLTSHAKEEHTKRILIVNSYDDQNLCSRGQIHGLLERFNSSSHPLDIQVLHMKTKQTFVSNAQMHERGLWALDIVSKIQPDVVVTVDDNSFREVGIPLLGSVTPVVFLGVNSPLDMYKKYHFYNSLKFPGKNITGIREQLFFKKSIDILKKSNPDLELVFVILDSSPTGIALQQQILLESGEGQGLETKFRLAVVDTFDQYQKLIHWGNCQKHLAIMPLVTRLGKDNGWMSDEEIVKWTIKNSKSPESSAALSYTALGYLGGVSLDYKAMGSQAADMVLRILDGASPGDLPIEEAEIFGVYFNLDRALALDVVIPPELLLVADEIFKTKPSKTQ